MPTEIQPAEWAGRWRGLMQRDRLVDHPHQYADEALNVELYGDVIATRGGTRRVSDTQLGDDLVGSGRRVSGLFQNKWRPGSSTIGDDIIAATGGQLQRVEDPPSANLYVPIQLPASAGTRLAATHRTHFTQLDNKTWIVDGTNDTNLKYYPKGSPGAGAPIIERMGIGAPFGAPTIAIVTGGSPPGLAFGRTYRCTAVNTVTQHESEPSLASAPTGAVAVGDRVRVTVPIFVTSYAGLAETDPQVDQIRVYGSTDGGDGVWFFLGVTVPGGTFVDDIPDTGLGVQMEEFVNDPPPPRMRLVVAWPKASRLLGVCETTPSILRFTDLVLGTIRGESWPPQNLIYVALDMGDDIRAIYPFSDSVLIVCRRSVWRLAGLPPTMVLEPVQFHETRTAIGGFDQVALVQVDDEIANPFLDGCYMMGRFGDIKGGFTSSRLSKAIDNLWGELNPTATRRAHAVYHRRRKQLRFWIPSGTENDASRCLVYQLDVAPEEDVPGGWTLWEFKTQDGAARHMSASTVVETFDGDRVYVASDDGYVLVMDQGSEDDWFVPGEGLAYPFIWTTVPVRFAQDRETRTRFLDIVFKTLESDVVVVTPIVELSQAQPAMTFALTASGGFLWGTSLLGEDTFGALEQSLHRSTCEVRGQYHQLSFRHDGKARIGIEKWTYHWQPLGRRTLPVTTQQAIPPYVIHDTQEDESGYGTGGYGEGGEGV